MILIRRLKTNKSKSFEGVLAEDNVDRSSAKLNSGTREHEVLILVLIEKDLSGKTRTH